MECKTMAKWSKGIFSNTMAWSCYGDGEKVALLIPGGPGNTAPATGWKAKISVKSMLHLLDHGYRLLTVARPRNLPQGHSVADMAADYARLIDEEFGGQVDLIVGSSYGGMIAQYLAADFPDRFKHIVVHVAACEVIDPEGIDQQFAQLTAEGRVYAAGSMIFKTMMPNAKFPFLIGVMGGVFSMLLADKPHEHLANDILVEAEAEKSFDAREALPRITVPVLLIGGDQDNYFPEELMRETASLIPDCTLRLYEGQNHIQAGTNPQLGEDIQEFIGLANG